ncbi:AMP-binding protein [Xanthobacteraceae bacterium A53D]
MPHEDTAADAALIARATWHPTDAHRREANWTRFLAFAGLPDYPALEAKVASDPDWFWEKLIAFLDVRFDTPFRKVRDLLAGIAHARWCVGGRMNMTATLLDRHLEAGRGAHPAVLFEAESGATRSLSYADLATQVDDLARGLVREGVRPGDVIGLFLPMVPEAVIAFLAVARVGGVVLPLFSGFGEAALVSRLGDGEAKMVITAEATVRRGRPSPMKATLDAALAQVPSVTRVIVVPSDRTCPMQAGRDAWWGDIATPGASFAPVIVEAEHPLMLIYTSGTTGKPKGTVHTHCSFTVKTGEDYLLAFDIKPSDRWIWMSDMGWLVGPLQIVATLMAGATLLLAEGGPDYPETGRMWRLIQDHKLTILGLSPTIARLMKSHGEAEVEKYDLSSLRAVASTGEPWDLASWVWIMDHVLNGRGPLMNNVGGTEMGGILATNILYPIKPTSFHGPIPGTGADIAAEDGSSVITGELGELVMRGACIGTTRGLWRNDPRYLEGYWSRFPDVWLHGDWASRDADGAWYVHGRSDDTIKLAGKRTGPAEIEALLLATGKVRDAAAVAVPDAVKGSAVVCAVVPAAGEAADEALAALLSKAVTQGLGAPFKPHTVLFVTDLPRTRNLKVMRRVIRAVLTGTDAGDVSALINPETVEELRRLAAPASA